MFRDTKVTVSQFVEKFTQLHSKLEAYDSIRMDFGYYKELKSYIDQLYAEMVQGSVIEQKSFDEKREMEMSNLNRLQKLKNSSSYKKSKHKKHASDEYL